MICIKQVCDLFDSGQGKKQSVQMTGDPGFVNYSSTNLVDFASKKACAGQPCGARRITSGL
ncbi:MAG TPA: hypothetical protein DD781_12625 [Leclercia adecarboxylata]|nr:hypothetical protein EXN74_00680 [Leclercia adecarboxylata]HBQ67326.1 hypothetical protein [Leclercia adecarboxylata]HBW40961.1 hypothetical protein [Leclercia adecarboxylata]HCQ11105.1 hypothetical protein [Leclercia adecarboxylata]